MKDNLARVLAPYRRTFAGFTSGQKAIAVIGAGALLLAGFMVFKWASTPSYAPLFGNLGSADAAAVIDELDSEGVPYKLTNGGSTVMVPQDKVYATRIKLSGQGLPSASDSGYSLLDEQSLSTSQFQEQTNFKRAMEAELANTIEAVNGVRSAVVHLALPQKQVFADEQDPATASVLVSATPGAELDDEKVQAIVHLVASSIDGLAPEKVTVADAAGKVLSATDGAGGSLGGTGGQQVKDYEDQMNGRIQKMLDRVVGPGNSTVAVTANLDLDKAVKETKTYTYNKNNAPLSETKNVEKYNGTGPGSGVTGVVGPDGQMEPGTGSGGAPSSYEKSSVTTDNAVGQTVERRETTPGAVRNLNVGVVLDAAAARNLDLEDIQGLISSAVGIDAKRDKIQVSTMPFDRTAEKAAKAELAAADKAAAKVEQKAFYRNVAFGVALLLIMLLAWLRARRRAKAREQATTYVVEQLRQEQADRAGAAAPAVEPPTAVLALEAVEASEAESMRKELEALVERQPEDVAALLRGWLVERP